MQLHVVKAEIIAQRVHVHLADTLGIVTRAAEFPGHRAAVVPVYAVLIANLAGVALAQTCVQDSACRDAGGTGGPGVRKIDAVRGEGVEIGRFYIRMTGAAQTVAALLVGHNQYKVRSLRQGTTLLSIGIAVGESFAGWRGRALFGGKACRALFPAGKTRRTNRGKSKTCTGRETLPVQVSCVFSFSVFTGLRSRTT